MIQAQSDYERVSDANKNLVHMHWGGDRIRQFTEEKFTAHEVNIIDKHRALFNKSITIASDWYDMYVHEVNTAFWKEKELKKAKTIIKALQSRMDCRGVQYGDLDMI